VIYFSFQYELILEPAKGFIWRLLRSDKNEETVIIKNWLIEFEEEENYACREIGLDEKGNVVYCSPSKVFYGYWADADMKFENFKQFRPKSISRQKFEDNWTEKFDE